MAEGGEEFGDIKENPEYRRFAEDLVNDLVLRICPDYILYTDKLGDSPDYSICIDPKTSNDFVIRLNKTIHGGIYDIASIVGPICGKILIEMRDRIPINSDSFLKLAEGLEIRNFSTGFNGRNLLIHCTTITSIAIIFFKWGKTATPGIAKFHITNVLQHRMLADEKSSVLKTAEVFLNHLGNRY